MSGHPSEPIGYVEQFKTDLWCSRAQRQSPDLASLLTVVLGCPLLGVPHASDGPPVDLSRYPRRSLTQQKASGFPHCVSRTSSPFCIHRCSRYTLHDATRSKPLPFPRIAMRGTLTTVVSVNAPCQVMNDVNEHNIIQNYTIGSATKITGAMLISYYARRHRFPQKESG